MKKEISWIYLAHMGYNMWLEPTVDRLGIHGQKGWTDDTDARDYLRFDEDYWRKLTAQLKEAGCSAILLDIGEAIQLESHPELAVKGSWSKAKMADELARLRAEGFAVYPKLNFSASHDQWLGEYSHMLSTSIYYKVTSDVIAEIAELFDKPAYFHLGMDEETAGHQSHNNYAVIRSGEQWWYDFKLLAAAVEKAGCRPWIWSDYAWHHEEDFFAHMSREVLQSNWYYGDFSDKTYAGVALYDKLEEAGYDQVPTGSNWSRPDNLTRTVGYCSGLIDPARLFGYMQTPWYPTLPKKADAHDGAIKDMIEAKKLYESQE